RAERLQRRRCRRSSKTGFGFGKLRQCNRARYLATGRKSTANCFRQIWNYYLSGSEYCLVIIFLIFDCIFIKIMFELLLYVFIAVVIIQFLYHVFLFSRLAFYKPQKLSVKDEPVSVILYTKNQADKLGTTIDTLLNQQYHTFEIVVINNASTD